MNVATNHQLRAIAERLGMTKPLTFHLARHSAAHRIYKQTRDIYQVKQILGHTSVQTTENYMRGLMDDALDDAMRLLEL